MLEARNNARDTAADAQRSREPTNTTNRDDTTVEFEGRMKVADDDGGGDPYNRTGRFRRAVR
jgi:hypothetical protein